MSKGGGVTLPPAIVNEERPGVEKVVVGRDGLQLAFRAREGVVMGAKPAITRDSSGRV